MQLSHSFVFALFLISLFACKHEPVVPNNPSFGGVCDPDSIYFQGQILPLLVSNCTEAGCHNAQDHEDGVVITSYQTLMSTIEHVTSNDWEKNKLIESLEESKLEKRMPQNKDPFTTAQIDLIKKWISQGAVNNACDQSFGGCDTIAGAKFATFVQPLIQNRCKGCHSGANPQGGISLSNYAEIKSLAIDGSLFASVSKSSGWMPKGGAKLDDCSLVKLKTWIDEGALNN